MFETAIAPFGTWIVSCQGVLKAGSSKHGNARRASIASNWVKTYQSLPSFSRKTASAPLLSIRPSYVSDTSYSPGGSFFSN